MIVRDRPSGLRMFLLLRGSVLQQIWPVLLVNVLLATVVTLLHGTVFSHKITLTAIPFTLIGLPLAIFLGFRNTAAYDRYWEARKLWGELLLRCRNLSRQCQSLIHLPQPVQAGAGLDDIRVRMVHRAIAFCHTLRQQLRGVPDRGEVQALLQPSEWQALQRHGSKTSLLMHHMGLDLQPCLRNGHIGEPLAASIDNTLSALVSAAASCERIKSSPLPFSYTLLLHRTAYMYCFLLPFGLVDTTGFMTPFVVGIVAYTFFGLDALGDEIEEPFGLESNDLPLDTLCRAIEVNLRESLGEKDLPPPIQAVNFQLT